MKAIAHFVVVIFVALIAVPALALTQTIATSVQLLATTVLMMGGTGTPLSPNTQAANELYMSSMLNGLFADNNLYKRVAVETPEEFWPSTGNDDLIFDESVAEGVEDLDLAIKQVYAGDPNAKVIVFGYSQSAVIIAKEKQKLADQSTPPPPSGQLEFVVVGSLSNPDGGLFTRLPGFVIPGLGVTFEPATPDDEYMTTSYVREYEGLADLPDNPLNLLAMGNALVGAAVLHPDYRNVDLTNTVALPSTDQNSKYVLIPTPRLPILMVLDGVVPEPVLAGLDPVLRWGVNLGYDRTTLANVPTPFTLAPTFNPITAASEFPEAVAKGIDAAASATNLSVSPLQSNSKASQSVSTPSAQAADRKPLRPLQILRESLKFDPPKGPSTIRSNGVGPLKRIVNALTGLRPKWADADESDDAPNAENQDDAA